MVHPHHRAYTWYLLSQYLLLPPADPGLFIHIGLIVIGSRSH